LLQPHAHRISSMTQGGWPPMYTDSSFSGVAYISLTSNIINSLGFLPSLEDLDFGREIRLLPEQLKPFDLPPRARIKSHIYIPLHQSGPLNRQLTLGGMGPKGYLPFGELRFSELLLGEDHSPSGHDDDTVSTLNARISALIHILSLLQSPSSNTSGPTSPSHMVFINGQDNTCMICNRPGKSFVIALGCVRTHFGIRSF